MSSGTLLGEVVDAKYRVEALLGRGGMGAVYTATHVGTGRSVALKVLVPELTANDDAVERFKREALATGRLRHPNVVDITDFGFAEQGGVRLAYLVMELLRGQTLRALLDATGRLPVDAAIEVLDQVCAGVAAAHAQRILHRDLKPENIHLEPGSRGRYRARVLDFGIAKLVEPCAAPAPFARSGAPPVAVEDASLAATLPALPSELAATPVDRGGALTELGAAIGTPLYMAPEQWIAGAVDVRTDVYALGVIAYEMLTGTPPFEGKGRSIAMEHTTHAPPPLLERAPLVKRGVARVIESALSKNPAQRPASARAFVAALHAETETTGKLLRRSILITTDHYGVLLRRTVLATLPGVATYAICLPVVMFAPETAGPMGMLRIVLALSAYVSILLANPVGGLLVPVVADLATPGAAVGPAPSASDLRRSLRASLLSTHVLLAGISAQMGLLAAGILFARHHLSASAAGLSKVLAIAVLMITFYAAITPLSLFGPVAAVERRGGLAPLRRSITLTRPVRRATLGVSLYVALLNVVVTGFVRLGFHTLAPSARVTETILGGLISSLCTAALFPFSFVALALLYLRAREAEGAVL